MPTAGTATTWGATLRYWRPAPSIAPNSGDGGWAPSPRKLRLAPMSMFWAQKMAACTTRIGTQAGRTWRVRIPNSGRPSARGLHELPPLHREDHRPDEPDVVRRRPRGDRDHGVQEARAEDGHEDDREQEVGEGEEEVGGAHDEALEQAAVEAGEEAEHHAHRHAGGDRHDADREGEPDAEQEPAEEAAADPVGAERILAAGRLEAEPEVGLGRVVRRQPARAESARQECGEHEGSGGRTRLAG